MNNKPDNKPDNIDSTDNTDNTDILIDSINHIEMFYTDKSNDFNRYCMKTGKSLLPIPYNEVKNLIAIHGFERSKMVIAKLQQSIALEWILTDDIALQRLVDKQPVEYLIYAMSCLLVSPKIDNTIDMLEDFNIKIKCNTFLHSLPWEQIVICAEAIRKLLASNRPIAIQEMIDNCKMEQICSSQESLFKFQLTLTECIKMIADGHYDQSLIDAKNRQKRVLFERQKQLTSLSTLEQEISDSLPNFDEIELPISELKRLIMKTTNHKMERIKTQERQERMKIINKMGKKTPFISNFENKPFAGFSIKKDSKS